MTIIHIPGQVRKIIRMLAEAGYQAYAVGGCVRDSLMGVHPHDWDICSSAPPYKAREIFAGYPVIETGIRHGTITVLLDHTGYEVTTFRTDGAYSDGRHPDSVCFVHELSEDLRRRDFTINAMAYNEQDGLVDLFEGAEDIAAGRIRCVGVPEDRFSEDVLRIMRAVRFASVLGFSIEEKTAKAVHAYIPALSRVSVERITAELRKMICGKSFGILAREYTDLLVQIIPELRPCVGFEQKSAWHSYDVWEHTIRAMEAYRLQAGDQAEELILLTLLLHDIGKPASCQEEGDVRHFKGHAAAGAAIADGILRNLRLDNHTREQVCELIRHHDDNWLPSQKGMRRTISAVGKDQTERLLAIRRADIMAQNPDTRQRSLSDLVQLEEYYRELLRTESCFTVKDLAVDGKDLMSIGMYPGREMGEMLDWLLDQVLEEMLTNDKEELLKAASIHRRA